MSTILPLENRFERPFEKRAAFFMSDAYWAVARDDNKTALFKGNSNGDWKEMARYQLGKTTTVLFKPDRQDNLWMANSGQFFNITRSRNNRSLLTTAQNLERITKFLK